MTGRATERVDFYVLKSASTRERMNFACRLTEKAYLRDLRVVVLSDNAVDAASLDDLLWTFNERSFVPHDLYGQAAAVSASVATSARAAASAPAATPVRLTADLAGVEHADLLVNLSERLPDRLERFARIAEIIDGDDERRRSGRARFKAYRELKLPVETHQLDDATGA